MKKLRKVQCSGDIKLGPRAGDQCKRSKMLPVDKSNNTKLFYCSLHKKSGRR